MDKGSRLARNFGYLLGGEAATRALALASAVVVARVMGPADFGALAVAQSLLLLAAAVVDGGLTLHGTADIVRDRSRTAEVVSAVRRTQLLLAAGAAAALAATAAALPTSGQTRTVLIVLLPYLFAQAWNLQYVLQAQERMRSASLFRLVGQFVSALFSVIAAVVTGDLVLVACGFWIGQGIADLLIVVLLRREGLRRVRVGLKVVGATARRGVPYLAGAVLGQYILAAPTVAVGVGLGDRAAGEYSAAFRIAFLLQYVISVVVAAIYPEMLRRRQSSPEDFAKYMNLLLATAVRAGFAIAALVAVVSPDLTQLVYGSEFERTGMLLTILGVVLPIAYYNALVSRSLMAAGLQSLLARQVGVVAVFATVAFACAVVFGDVRTVAVVAVLVALAQAALFTRGAGRLGLRTPLVLLAELPYLALPVMVVAGLEQARDGTPVWIALVCWSGVVTALEAAGGWRTARLLRRRPLAS